MRAWAICPKCGGPYTYIAGLSRPIRNGDEVGAQGEWFCDENGVPIDRSPHRGGCASCGSEEVIPMSAGAIGYDLLAEDFPKPSE
jgi:hypothetical protein